MDIETQSQAQPNQWAKSTESKIEVFLDDFLIKSAVEKVRSSTEKLLESLFIKGNAEQKLRIISLLENRCDQLVWMGMASQNFLNLVKKIFALSDNYQEERSRIIKKIFIKLQTIHNTMISDHAYEFYSFTSNFVDFGDEEFKPYLLEANGCLGCYGRQETKPEPFKLESYLQTLKLFTNKLEYIFKRIYEVKDLTINLKLNARAKAVSVFYIDENKEMKKIGKFKAKESISFTSCKLQGLYFEFDVATSIVKKRAQQCIFCDGVDEMNCVCQGCGKRSDTIEIGGSFNVIGADEELISNDLCRDYEKIKERINCIRNLHRKIEKKEKISLSFRIDEMMEIYQRIISNISLFHNNNPSKLKRKEIQNCFSCNYYQTLSIINFLKETIKSSQRLLMSTEECENFKEILKECLSKSKIESMKTNLLQTFSVFIVNEDKTNLKQELNGFPHYIEELVCNILIALKERRNSYEQTDEHMIEIRCFLNENWHRFSVEQKIKMLVCWCVEWQFLCLILANSFNHQTKINRVSMNDFEELKIFIDFQITEVFNLPLTSYLKAFLKIIPHSILPIASFDISDCQFLHYVNNKVPEIQKSQIEESIICCPNPMIKLDVFASLPIMISKLPVKESMNVMNSLFPFRNVWNLNIIKACHKFEEKLAELPAEEQIYTCLSGYSKSKEYLYIKKIYKLLVPQRSNFIIRFEAPLSEIEINNIEYPYLPIRDVKSEDLQGDTIKALHSWVFAELVKLNQAMPLDIIVEKNIIDNMDLPIELVYQNIAENKSKKKIGDKEYDFFRVIYRIQGILGEPKQRSIGNLRDQKLETCISYASFFLNRFSDEFDNKIGLDVLIEILESIELGPENQDKKVLLFEILSTISMNESICNKIVEDQYGDSIINATVRLMSFLNEKDAKITNFLLQLSSKVIDEANKEMINLRKGSAGEYRKMNVMDIEATVSESLSKVSFVLEKINECEATFEKTNNILYRDISRRLIKLLPFCSKDEIESSRLLFNFFDLPNWSSKPSSKMENLYIFVDSLSESYMTFKSITNENGITHDITQTITNSIRKEGLNQIDENKLSLNRSTTESGLALLFALVQGDEKLQGELFDTNVFHNIFEISQIPPKKAQEIHAGRVPEHCYKIIKYFSDGKIVDERISKFLDEKKKIEKEKIEPKKNKKWENMKNKQKITLSKKMEDEAGETEKDLITCLSCHEGYSTKKEILGLYIYQTKTEIPYQANWWKDTHKILSYNSSTFFTAIHYECHIIAMETDAKMMRSEWDGALIRNMDVLCNSWIPFKGPKTTFDEFLRVERKYFEKNKTGNYWNALNDLSALINKLSLEFDFATESKGSSSSHNFRYIPIQIGFCCHLIERLGGCTVVEEGIEFLLENPPKKLEMMNLLMSFCLFTTNFATFQQLKPKFLTFIISLKSQDKTLEKQFSEIKSSLICLKIIEEIYEIIHKKVSEGDKQGAKKFYKELEIHVSSCLNEIVSEFELLNERYKSKYTKYGSIDEFGF